MRGEERRGGEDEGRGKERKWGGGRGEERKTGWGREEEGRGKKERGEGGEKERLRENQRKFDLLE